MTSIPCLILDREYGTMSYLYSMYFCRLMSAVHSLLCDGILNGEAGDTLLTVLSVGVDFLNQKSFECGRSVFMIHLLIFDGNLDLTILSLLCYVVIGCCHFFIID